LEAGQTLPVTLELPFSPLPIQATGEIMWVRQAPRLGPARREVGLQFRWVEEPDRQRLSRHLTSVFAASV